MNVYATNSMIRIFNDTATLLLIFYNIKELMQDNY